ncbi:hypothetical protein BOBR111200_20355 [Bordetella bronchialis]
MAPGSTLPRRRPPMPPPMREITTMTMNSRMMKTGTDVGPSRSAATWRWMGAASGSPLSTFSMAPVPSAMPLLKSPCRKAGMMIWLMMADDIASVSVPSRP